MPLAPDQKQFFSVKYILITLVAVVASWELHEASHWLTGTLLGNTMSMTMNQAFPASGHYNGEYDFTLVSAVGPLVTLLQAIVFFILLRRNASLQLFPFLFICFYMRLLALGLSFIHPNDEARISRDLGFGMFTLPVIMTALLLFLVVKIIRERRVSRFQVTVTTILTIIFSSAIILTDQALH